MAKKTIKVEGMEGTSRTVVLNIIGLREIQLEFLIESPETYKALADSKSLIRELMTPAEQGRNGEAELFCDVCARLAGQGMAIRDVMERSLTQKSWIELSEVYDRLPYETLIKLYRTLCDMVERRIIENMEKETRNNGL